jgi:hypothetical protein
VWVSRRGRSKRERGVAPCDHTRARARVAVPPLPALTSTHLLLQLLGAHDQAARAAEACVLGFGREEEEERRRVSWRASSS